MLKAVLSILTLMAIAGCASMYGGANLSDDALLSDVAGVLGEDPVNLKLESRRTEGLNTYMIVTTKKSTKFACNVTGGGILALGMRAAPSCKAI
jgi:hypothetical protein